MLGQTSGKSMGGNHFANSIYCFGQVVIGFVVVKGVGINTQDIEEDLYIYIYIYISA
jgi:hypothetical protein